MALEDPNLMDYAVRGGGGGLLALVAGWLIRSINKNRDDLAEHKIYVAQNYATKLDLTAVNEGVTKLRDDMNGWFQRLDQKLDGKADKK